MTKVTLVIAIDKPAACGGTEDGRQFTVMGELPRAKGNATMNA